MNTRNWALLLEAIAQRRVVIVLGDGLFSVLDNSGKQVKVVDYVKNALLEKFPLRDIDTNGDADFSLIEEQIEISNFLNRRNNDSTNIYFEVFHLLRDKKLICQKNVLRLLSLKQFPLVLSTSYIQQLPELLGIGEDRVFFYKKSAVNEVSPVTFSASSPTLYYMFGRANSLSRSFMVTEEDYLDYLHHWHNSECRPLDLCRYLSDKFFLVLGCDYPNWVFRFFWHSIKNFNLPSLASSDTEGIVSLEQSDDMALRRFLSRIQAQVCDNVDVFVEELISHLGQMQYKSEDNNSETPSDVDVFISYASEDVNLAQQVADTFSAKGANVWFDKRELKGGDEYERLIKHVITHSKRFVPIVSKNTLIERRRFFRKEWAEALGEKAFRLNMEFIVPVRIDNFPIDSPLLPDEFRDAHFLNFMDVSIDSFEQQVVDVIRKMRK